MNGFGVLLLSLLLVSFCSHSSCSPVKKNASEAKSDSTLEASDDDPEVSQLVKLKNQLSSKNNAEEKRTPLLKSEPPSNGLYLNEENRAKKDKKESLSSKLRREMQKATKGDDREVEISQYLKPTDLALYVARTGDEDGASIIIEEMVSKNMLTPEEAIEYMSKIRQVLRFLYEQNVETDFSRPFDTNEITPALPGLRPSESMLPSDLDYESILEKSLSRDPPTARESYEEVIYQLAKLIFIRGADREGSGTERTLRELTQLFAKDVERGVLSHSLEKRLVGLVITALMDEPGLPLE